MLVVNDFLLFQMIIDAENGLKNTMTGDRVLTKKSFDDTGKAVNKDKWYMSPATVNAYYNAKGGKCCGIIRFCFWN